MLEELEEAMEDYNARYDWVQARCPPSVAHFPRSWTSAYQKQTKRFGFGWHLSGKYQKKG